VPNNIKAETALTQSASIFVLMSNYDTSTDNYYPFCNIGSIGLYHNYNNGNNISGWITEPQWGPTYTNAVTISQTKWLGIGVSRISLGTGYYARIYVSGFGSQISGTRGTYGDPTIPANAKINYSGRFTKGGKVYAGFKWTRLITDSEVDSLTANPYQFLIPA
jgi:hypothetical protein